MGLLPSCCSSQGVGNLGPCFGHSSVSVSELDLLRQLRCLHRPETLEKCSIRIFYRTLRTQKWDDGKAAVDNGENQKIFSAKIIQI